MILVLFLSHCQFYKFCFVYNYMYIFYTLEAANSITNSAKHGVILI